MRFLSIICGGVVLLGAFSSAQEPSLQSAPNRARPPGVFRPQAAGNPSPSPPPAQTPLPTPAQQPPVRAPQSRTSAMFSPVPDPPATSPLPEQLPPPTPPQVTYPNGQLTLQALNTTLSSLLTAIRNKTGIQFEGLEGGANAPVAVSIGPAPEGEVLAAILGGSTFGYLVLDPPDSPANVQPILLTPPGGSSTPPRTQPPRPA